MEHGRPAFAESDGSYVGQDAGIAPHAEACGRRCCAGGDVFTLCGLAELVHVVTDVERAGAEGAEGLWSFGREVMVTAGTFERGNDGHILDATVKPFWWPSGRDRYARRGHFVTGIPLRLALPLVGRKILRRPSGGPAKPVYMSRSDRCPRRAVSPSMAFEPAAGREVHEDTGRQKRDADGEGADDPVELHTALQHEPVEQGQDEDQNRRFRKERRTARGCDGDEVQERRGFCLGRSSAAGWNQRNSTGGLVGGLGRRIWNLLR